jgi:hypothetical protein
MLKGGHTHTKNKQHSDLISLLLSLNAVKIGSDRISPPKIMYNINIRLKMLRKMETVYFIT